MHAAQYAKIPALVVDQDLKVLRKRFGPQSFLGVLAEFSSQSLDVVVGSANKFNLVNAHLVARRA